MNFHSFQSAFPLINVLSFIQLLQRVEIHSFTFREYVLYMQILRFSIGGQICTKVVLVTAQLGWQYPLYKSI